MRITERRLNWWAGPEFPPLNDVTSAKKGVWIGVGKPNFARPNRHFEQKFVAGIHQCDGRQVISGVRATEKMTNP
jgi:hypothetical protein